MTVAGGSAVTIVIPTWNGWGLLERCLASLQRQSRPHATLVVDNGSSDGTPELLSERFPEVGLLRLEKNLGFAAAVNHGIGRIETPIVGLLNNDTEADPDWIRAALDAFDRHPETWIIASLMLDFHRRDVVDSAGDCYRMDGMALKRGNGEPVARYQSETEVTAASAGAAFYRRELFNRIGLFDEDFYMYLEDVDLSLRARLAGCGCRFVPASRVYHIEAASDPEREVDRGANAAAGGAFYSSRRVFWITRNRWLLMITYQPWRSAPWLLYGWTRSLLFHVLKVGHAVSFLKGLAAGVKSTPRALSKRRRLSSLRRIDTGELWQLLRRC